MVHTLLDDAASRHPDKVALVCAQRRVTYAELRALAAKLAAGLRNLGVKRGDRVVSCLENGVEAVAAVFGVFMAGAVIVPIGRTVKATKLAHILRDCSPRVVIADARACATLDDAFRRSPGVAAVVLVGEDEATALSVHATSLEALLATVGSSLPSDGIDLDLAALIYTSGSSGVAKGVMLTHANMLSAVTSINGYLANTTDDVILSVLPLSFDYGLYQVFLACAGGARLILERAFAYPAALLDLAVSEGATGLPVVPTLAALLVYHDLRAYDLSRLRYITNTGAALPPAHIAALRSALPHTALFSMYGLTECKRVSFLPPGEVDQRPDSVGKPMDNVEVLIASEDGNLSATGVGELVVRGSNVMQGYWGAAEVTARVLKPGLHPGERLLYTGDRFRIDDGGYMHFDGRLDDMLKCRGQRVSPKEVENALYELGGVTAAAVVGVPDELLGTAIKALLVVDRALSISKDDVLRHCAERLEDFMVPRDVEFLDALPTTESGKIVGRKLLHGTATR